MEESLFDKQKNAFKVKFGITPTDHKILHILNCEGDCKLEEKEIAGFGKQVVCKNCFEIFRDKDASKSKVSSLSKKKNSVKVAVIGDSLEKPVVIVDTRKSDVYFADSIKSVKEMPDSSCDGFFTDPPYGMDYKSNFSSHSKISNDNNIDMWVPDWCKDIYRVSRNDRFSVVFCSVHKYEFFKQNLESAGFKVTTCRWYKRKNAETAGGALGDLNKPIRDWEYFLVCEKGKPKLSRRIEDTIFQTTLKEAQKYHPTAKPEELWSKILSAYSRPGDYIIDLFGGSGSIIPACKALNIRYGVYEFEEKYFELVKNAHISSVDMKTQYAILKASRKKSELKNLGQKSLFDNENK